MVLQVNFNDSPGNEDQILMVLMTYKLGHLRAVVCKLFFYVEAKQFQPKPSDASITLRLFTDNPNF